MSNYRDTNMKGFTLLEVLVAIAIFSVISLTSFTVFDTVLKSDETSKYKTARINELQRAFLIMDRDFIQLARRKMRLNGEESLEGFLHTEQEGLSTSTQALGFIRGGWTNPGLILPRSDLQSVGYQLNEETQTLERLHFTFVDTEVGTEPKARPLITQVTDMHFEFYKDKKWEEEFTGDKLPNGIAIVIETEDYGELRRQFLTPGDF